MTLKETFNWLAEPPKHGYRLTELYQHFVKGQPWSDIPADNPWGMTRGGLFYERFNTAAGATMGIVTGLAPFMGQTPDTLPTTVVMAVGGLMFMIVKTQAVVSAKYFDHKLKYCDLPYDEQPGLIKSSLDDIRKAKESKNTQPKP